MRRIFLFITLFITLSALSQDPTVTNYTFDQCQGSLRPYPAPETSVAVPDSLTPVMINHVGRHGARFPASAAHTVALRHALLAADSAGTITATGRRLLELTTYVVERCHNLWGALDSLGMAEQRGIASRMFMNYPSLFDGTKVKAISSYSPRCVMSMYEFTHQLDRLNNRVEITTTSGRQNSMLMRPFDLSDDYKDYIKSKVWETPYRDVMDVRLTSAPLKRILGDVSAYSRSDIESTALAEYYFLAGLQAMSLDVDMSQFLTREEANALWSLFNLRQYLQRTATTLSSAPAVITSPLVLDLIRTTDNFIDGDNATRVFLRFGHAETLMPLYSLLHLPGCYYLTNYFDTVGQHWRDFDVVPMAANLQMILLRSDSGAYYVRFDRDEMPTKLIPNDERIYIPWREARNYMIRCLPLIDQP